MVTGAAWDGPLDSRQVTSIRASSAASLAAALVVGGCGDGSDRRKADPPLLVPWHRIGDLELGESRARVESEYGVHGYHAFAQTGQGYYLLHGSKVWVTFDNGRVSELGFTTPYYRTKSRFGVGSRIPLGPCHGTATSQCEHRWHGFVWNAWTRESACNCWVKVGRGARSLHATTANFLKPWFFIDTRPGRVTGFHFSSRFVD